MNDRQRLQTDPDDDRSLHKVCRGRALHNSLSRRDMRPSDQYVDSKTWMSNDIPIGQWNSFRRRTYQEAQAHSTTYHPQTNGSVERPNRTLVSMLRVDCSRYMTDWDRYLPQVMGVYNRTQTSTTGISPHMMLTGHEKFCL